MQMIIGDCAFILRTHFGKALMVLRGLGMMTAQQNRRNVMYQATYKRTERRKKTNEQNPSKKERKIQFRKREVTQKEHYYLFLFLQSQNLLH